jgi:hypothetical protein
MISGPKPMEKAVTPTPHQRPTRKWPISCTNTTIVSTIRNGITAPKKPAALPPMPLKNSMAVILQAATHVRDPCTSCANPSLNRLP